MEPWLETTIKVSLYISAGMAIIFVAWSLWADKNLIYTSRLSSLSVDDKKHVMGIYYLPETVLDLRVTVKVCIETDANNQIAARITEYNFETTTITLPDVSTPLALQYKSNPNNNDEIVFTVNESGLLETLDATSDNQTAKIVSTLVNATGASMSGLIAQGMTPGLQLPGNIEVKEFTKEFKINAWATLNNETPIPWAMSVTSDSGSVVSVQADFTVESTISGITAKPASSLPGAKSSGLIFRSKVPASLKIKTGIPNLTVTQNGLTYFHKGDLFSVPICSSPFVERKHSLKVVNGQLTSHTLTNPSSMLGFVAIPVDILKAIVSIPAQLISFRIDNVTKKRELEKAQNDLSDEMIRTNDIAHKTEKLAADAKIQKLEASLAQAKIDRALATQGFEAKLRELQEQVRILKSGT